MASPLVRALTSLAGGRRRSEKTYFDAGFYSRTYADVAATGVDPFAHFAGHGWREGRNPSPTFSTLYYRDAHLDGAQADPLAHWVAAGGPASRLETVAPTPQSFIAVQRAVVADHFDTAFYALQRGGTADDPIGHYLTDGWRSGLSPSPHFDPTRYAEENRFVETLGVAPFYHWCSQHRMRASTERPDLAGSAAIPPDELRRVVEPAFDAAFYLAKQADVRKAKLDPLDHYLDHGWRERRDPHPLFDSAYYRARNRDVATQRIDPYYHYLTIGKAEGRRPNPVGPHLYPAMTAPTDWRDARPAADVAGADWVVVMPVYRGHGETLAAIHSVLVCPPQGTRFALHVVNDRSPDPALTADLERLAGLGLFSLDANPRNLGFVKTCHRALRALADKEVVLLNADAMVFGNWLDRLAEHARRDPVIATITPLSNNATICSYPLNNANNAIEPELGAAALDRLAATVNAGRVSEVATGVGFCFFMSKAARAAVGLFDEEAFGRGYGEENDFCLRAAKAGFRNVLAEDVYAYHRGEVSFAELADTEYGPGQKALHAKHPDYLTRVGQHLRADPGFAGRMRLDLARLARFAGPRSMLFVSHALAGGIVTHIRHMQRRLRAEGIRVVHLRVGVKDRFAVEIACDDEDAPFLPNLAPASIHQVGDLVAEFVGWLDPLAIHVHSLVGFDWRATERLFDLVRREGKPYYFTLHDYSVVCHRNDLVPTNGRYCGLPEVDVCRLCVAGDRSYPEALDPAIRRARYREFLNGAAAVFAPSRDVAARLAEAGADYRIDVRPHEEGEFEAVPLGSRDAEGPIDIVTVGAIGGHKGSRVLLGLARDAQARDLSLRFHIVGYSDVTEEWKGAGGVETGRYVDDEEAALAVASIRPALMLLPSIWPETFCYTLSLAFRLGVPPVVFDLGAQAERVAAEAFGHALPLALIDDPSAMNDALIALAATGRQGAPAYQGVRYADMLRDYYRLPQL